MWWRNIFRYHKRDNGRRFNATIRTPEVSVLHAHWIAGDLVFCVTMSCQKSLSSDTRVARIIACIEQPSEFGRAVGGRITVTPSNYNIFAGYISNDSQNWWSQWLCENVFIIRVYGNLHVWLRTNRDKTNSQKRLIQSAKIWEALRFYIWCVFS